MKKKKQKRKNRNESQKDNAQQNTNSNDNKKDVAKTTESSFPQKSGGFGENQCFCCGNTALQKDVKDSTFDQWVSHLMADNADHEKFGGLQSGSSSQCGLNNDQCPKNIESVADASNNCNWDNDWKEKKQKKKQRKKSQKDDNGQQNANSNNNEKDVAKMTESSFLQKSKGFDENQCFLLWQHRAPQQWQVQAQRKTQE